MVAEEVDDDGYELLMVVGSGSGAGSGAGSSFLCRLFRALTMQNTAKAMMMKSRMTAMVLPNLTETSAAVSTRVPSAATSVTASFSTHFHWLKSMPPVIMEIRGMMMSLTMEVVILPNAPPMTTPTAMSITLPRMAKVLNSSKNFFIKEPPVCIFFSPETLALQGFQVSDRNREDRIAQNEGKINERGFYWL